LFDFLAQNSSTVFLPEIKNVVHEMYAERVFNKTILANLEMPIQLVASTPTIIYQTTSGEKITTQLPGVYNFENIQMAIAIGKHFKLSDEACNQGIANYLPSNHRSQFIKSGSNQVLMDAYNANPTSMHVAISHFAGTPNDPKVLILGDMFELGEESMKEHADLGELISTFKFEKILLVGEQMQHALIHLPQAFYFPDKFGLHNWLQDNPINNSFILIKGSRGIQLESVLPFLAK
jgi:UDP-N-acetylmuramoyl-tripeptide--D-alanyl-D-alanine ligase